MHKRNALSLGPNSLEAVRFLFYLSDEVGGHPGFGLGEAVGFFAQGDGAVPKSDEPAQGLQSRLALLVLVGLAGGAAMDGVPVLAGGDGHVGDGEIFVSASS